MTIQELLQTLSQKVVNHVTCTESQYNSLAQYDDNTIYYLSDTQSIYKGAVKYCSMKEIGNTANLLTSNKTIVNAINEIKTIAENNSGGGGGGSTVINDSTISPFSGFITTDINLIPESYGGLEEGEVWCTVERNRFVYKIGSSYYANWSTANLYNNNYSTTEATIKTGKIFSFSDQHFIALEGRLKTVTELLSATEINRLIQNVKAAAVGEANTNTQNKIRALTGENVPISPSGGTIKNYIDTKTSDLTKIIYCTNITDYEAKYAQYGDNVLYVIEG